MKNKEAIPAEVIEILNTYLAKNVELVSNSLILEVILLKEYINIYGVLPAEKAPRDRLANILEIVDSILSKKNDFRINNRNR